MSLLTAREQVTESDSCAPLAAWPENVVLYGGEADLVMMALDRKHVVAKRISFIIGGIYDQLVSTMYYITMYCNNHVLQ